MNAYMTIILAALVINAGMELLADFLNTKALGSRLPEAFIGIYSQEKYIKAQGYTRTRTRFGMLVKMFDLMTLLVFWFAGWFNGLDQIVRQFGFSRLCTGMLYIGTLVVLKTLLDLPFTVYATFVIEQRFGFNKTTVATFILDLLKGLLLAVILGGLLLAGVLFILEHGGGHAWLYGWLGVSIFILCLQFIAPTWLLPLFNKFVPLQQGSLRDAIMQYARTVDFKLDNIFVMDGSRRSTKSNAFFTGFGPYKRIALFDTLINNHSTAELIAILAHEIGHYKKKHILQGVILSIAHLGVMFYLFSLLINKQGLFEAFFMQHTSIYAGLVFFGLLMKPVEMMLAPLLHAFSRKNEYEADRFAAATIPEVGAMITALKNLSRDNLANLTPHPFYILLNYSHPPVLKRIEALQRKSLTPPDGQLSTGGSDISAAAAAQQDRITGLP
jgi:STE24 endopeptidase